MKAPTQIVTLVLLALLVVVGVSAKPKKQIRVASGTWAGENIVMNVGEKSTTIEFGCAHGTIEGPLMTDSKGQFNWKGTFSAEHGGPIRVGEENAGNAVVYSGSIKGQLMTLVIKHDGEAKQVDTFTLTRGATVRLRKCL